MWYSFSRISTPTMGLSLLRLREFYVTKVQNKLAYNVGAWFLDLKEVKSPVPSLVEKDNVDVKCSTSQTVINELKQIQRKCLLKVTGARDSASFESLCHLLNIEPIWICLQRRALTYQIRALGSETSKFLHECRLVYRVPTRGPGIHTAGQRHEIAMATYHPYHALELKARDTMRLARQNRQNWELLVKTAAKEDCIKFWEMKRKRAAWITRPCYLLDWGKHAFDIFKNLDRAQASIIFQIMTGHIGLADHLWQFKVCPMDGSIRSKLTLFKSKGVIERNCGCGLNEPETAEHLFLRCRYLDKERKQLRAKLGHSDFWLYVHPRDNDVRDAANWAIDNFGLEIFKHEPQRFVPAP